MRCPKHERAELTAAEPEKFRVPAHEASSAWVRVRLGVLEDVNELYDILVDSWKQAVPDGLLETCPGLGPASEGPDERSR